MMETNELVAWVKQAAVVGIEEVSFALDAKTHEESDVMNKFFHEMNTMCLSGDAVKNVHLDFANKITPEGYLVHVHVEIGLIVERE